MGRYRADSMDGVVGEIVQAGERLLWFVTAGRPDRPWLELYPTGESRFIGLQSVGNAIYTFEQDDAGRVTGLTVETGGFTIPFERLGN